MASYTVQSEAVRVLQEMLLESPNLSLPQAFKEAGKNVKFTGGDGQPFVPTPLKITESSSALNALVATAASAVANDRYGIGYQDIEVNT